MDLKFTVDRKQNVNVQQPTKYEHARWTFCHTQRNCRETMSHVETHVRRTCAVDEVQPCSTNPQHPSKNCLYVFKPYGGNLFQCERNYSNQGSIIVGGHSESECSGLRVAVEEWRGWHTRWVCLQMENISVRTVNDTKF